MKPMQRIRHFTLTISLILALAVNGCIGTLDAVLWLQGSIVDEHENPYSQCIVTVLDSAKDIMDEIPLQWTRERYESGRNRLSPETGSNFLTLSILPPFRTEAFVTFSCVGSDQLIERRIVENSTTPEKPFDLGKLVLRRR